MAVKESKYVKNQRIRKEAEEQAKLKRRKQTQFSLIITCIVVILAVAGVITGIIISNAKDYSQIRISQFYVTQNGNRTVSPFIKDLNGKDVYIRGYMCPSSNMSDIMVYITATPGTTCPFCTSIYADAIPVTYKNNKKINFTNKLVEVKGVLEVSLKKDVDGFDTPFRIYIDDIKIV